MEKLLCPIFVIALAKDPNGSKEDMLCRQEGCEWWVEKRDKEGCAFWFIAHALIHIGIQVKDNDPSKITFGKKT